MKAGKEYELLIEQMYRSLEPNAEITHDDHIYDERAKISRQIDVSIKYQFAGTDHLIIVQAKDYKIKADIKVVDQFQQVIEDVNANKGILICSKGFSSAALNKAKSYGIECLTVYSALDKRWETILKIPVRKVVHEFSLNFEMSLDVAHRAGKETKMFIDTFSYDGLNVISLVDIIQDNIIDKMGWEYIKQSKNLKIDLKKLGLFHSLNDEMVHLNKGYLEIFYRKSSIKNFYVKPTNYIYASDHIKSTNKLHDLTIAHETLEEIITSDQENDKDLRENPIISVNVFRYMADDLCFTSSSFSLNFNGRITGDFILKGNKFIKNDERGQEILNLEDILRNRQ
ncbi:restriction endonuclease [Chryseobacterium sp. C-71]|uniref:restriction endonuclease n=1 Tax=Chryseobacterium sp. C-71 TaxID=2893882 RepID=UPI001E45AFA8|nr:restriction endonuclease [Chryseobacterium sp. C-71]UFH32815.1 restriction endonuclease [Chryseobacterium sp. C-71]